MTTTRTTATAPKFTHVRVGSRLGYNVVNVETQEVVSHHIGDGRSIHAGRTLAIRDAAARNAQA